jgi:branched-chain amino acid aminotransferase
MRGTSNKNTDFLLPLSFKKKSMKMPDMIYLNGELVPSEQATLHISDLGLLRGYGIFDFFRAIDGQPVFLEDHLDRLENSARRMELSLPVSRNKIRQAIFEIVRLHSIDLLGIKVILTGGYSPDGYAPAEQPNLIIFGKPFQFSDTAKGMKLMTVEYVRELADIKTLNYAFPILHLSRMKKAGADDVLYHKDGMISESSRSNIFIVKGEKVITPNTHILYGITRKHALAVAREHFLVEERPVKLAEAWQADEMFTTASTKRLTPITHVDGQSIGGGQPGKITRKLSELFLERESLSEIQFS